MAVLNREEFFAKLMERMGSDASDEAIKFVEDVTDTYNSLANNAGGDIAEMQKKYDALDAAWRKRYMSRFFNGGSSDVPEEEKKEVEVTEETIKPEDLFEEVEEE